MSNSAVPAVSAIHVTLVGQKNMFNGILPLRPQPSPLLYHIPIQLQTHWSRAH